MEFDINRPWLTLDKWQEDYIHNTDPNADCFLLCGRQVGKTTAMSIKAVELCMKHFKKGDYVLINSITEKQAYHMLNKALIYARDKYSSHIKKGKDRPTMHKILFKNGTGILCYAAGERGEGLRGFTIKKLMMDEASRMSDEYFVAITPALSVVRGSMDLASTPCGKERFFYKASLDPKFKQFYVSAEDCPRHTKEFLKTQQERLSKLEYAQEYLAIFTDELKRLFSDELIKRCCTIKKMDVNKVFNRSSKYYLGVDVAGFGKDECTYEVLERTPNNNLVQVENLIDKRNLTTDTTRKIMMLDHYYKFKKIGVDDGGIGFGVFSELLSEYKTKGKTVALNNAARSLDKDDTKKKRLLKEDMYYNLLSLMENNKIKLLHDDELIASLSSIQNDEGKIFGSYSHITEGLIRAAWLAEKDKSLNIFAHSF